MAGMYLCWSMSNQMNGDEKACAGEESRVDASTRVLWCGRRGGRGQKHGEVMADGSNIRDAATAQRRAGVGMRQQQSPSKEMEHRRLT